MNRVTLEWLHPDGRVGGKWMGGPNEGQVFWAQGEILGTVMEARDGSVVRIQEGASVDASCSHSSSRGERCGGCDLDRWPQPSRKDALLASVSRAYRCDLPDWVPSPRLLGTRARIKLAIVDGRVGYFVPRSHDFVAIEHCAVARPEIEQALLALLPHSLSPDLESVELRSDGERVVYAFRRKKGAHKVELPPLGDVALDGRAVQGNPILVLPHRKRPLRASPNSFFQVHLELNQALCERVCDAVLAVEPERILDLYSGIGNFTIPLAEAGVPVEAVELDGQATADLKATAHDLTHVKVTAMKAERFDPQACPFDVVVMDPPRAGAGVVMDRVLKSRPRRVVHVACDPIAGARDVSRALKAGYRRTQITCFDLFPQTHHVETVTVLDR